LEHASVVLSQAIAHHHPWLATGCEDGHARIWDISTGALLSDLKLAEPHNNVDAVEFSADDQVLAATAGQAGTVVWTTEDWSEMERIGAHSLSLTFCGIEQHLILGNGFDRQITRWDFRQTNNLQFLHRFPTNVYCLRSASESPFFVAGGGAVHVLMENGILSRVLPGSGGRVQGLAFSPHDRRLAGACFDGNVRCWDLSFDLPSLLFESHNASKVMLSPQSPWIIVVDNAFGMLVFDKRSGRESAQRPSILPLLTSPNGNYVVAHSPPEQKFHLLQLPSAETIAILESEKNTIACAFSHDEKTLAMSDVDGTTRIYDIPSCTIRNRWQLPIEFWEKSNSLALSDDGALLMCHFQWTIDTRTGKRTDLPADLSFLSRSASHPAIRNYSPDGRLRSSIEDVEGVVLLMIRNTLTNELLHAIHHKDSLAGLHCWSPDGKRIAAITASHDLVLFDPVGGSQVAELDRPPASIASLHFEDDGQTLKALAIGKGRLEWFVWKAPRDAPVKTTPR
jgi:WD40 repeat protein